MRGAATVGRRLSDLVLTLPWAPLVIAYAAGLLCAALFGVDWLSGPLRWSNESDPQAQAFLDQGETVLWVALVCIQTGLWALLLVPSIRVAKAVGGRHPKLTLLGIGLMALIAVKFVLVTSAAHGEYPLPGRVEKFAVLSVVGFVVCGSAVLALWWIYAALDDADSIRGLVRLRELMHQALGILGAVLTAGVLTTGALRNALIAWSENPANLDPVTDPFPLEDLLGYGVFFSALLALIYAPVHMRYQSKGRELMERHAPLPDVDQPGWSAALQRRNELQGLLLLGVTPTASFQAGVAILAPLASSLLAVLVPTS
jgi:hypothetical protein